MSLQSMTPAVLDGLGGDTRKRLERAAAWDLAAPRRRSQRQAGWSDREADEATAEYRKFIMMVVLNPGASYGVAEKVDEIWHQHILDTRDYAAMCDAIVGAMIHHIPSATDEERDLTSARETTITALRRIFRTPLSPLWQSDAHAVAKCCSHVVAET